MSDSHLNPAPTTSSFYYPQKQSALSLNPRSTAALHPLLLNFVARNTFDNQSGQINLDAAKLGTPASGTFTFATIRFRALAPTSSTSITFGPTTDALRTGNSVLGDTHNTLITVNLPEPHATATATPLITPTSTPNAARETLYLPIIRR